MFATWLGLGNKTAWLGLGEEHGFQHILTFGFRWDASRALVFYPSTSVHGGKGFLLVQHSCLYDIYARVI